MHLDSQSVPSPPDGRRGTYRSVARGLAPIAGVAAFFVLWVVLTGPAGVAAYILPAPADVVRAFGELSGTVGPHLATTIYATAVGLTIAGVGAFVTAIAMDLAPLLRQSLYPLLVISQTVPLISLAPLFILWFGFGVTPRIVSVALVAFFPLLVSLVEGMLSVDGETIALMRTFRARRVDIIRHVTVPASMVSLFSGLRISVTYGVMGAVIGEWLGGSYGIGVLMIRAQRSYAPDKVFALIGIVVVLSLALFGLVVLAQRLAMPWNAPSRRHGTRSGRGRRHDAGASPASESGPPVGTSHPPVAWAPGESVAHPSTVSEVSEVPEVGRETLEIGAVAHSFGDLPVIEAVSLSLDRGTTVALVGPSGCGKSTLLSIVAGLLRPTRGSVVLDGVDRSGQPGFVSYMPQDDRLLPWKSLLDNVALPRRLAGEPWEGARAASEGLLRRFGLDAFASTYPSRLSGGMRRRGALLRTYALSPEFVLLDEPFANVDTITRSRLYTWFREVNATFRAGVLFVTHDPEEAAILADQILLLGPRPTSIIRRIDVPSQAVRTDPAALVRLRREIEDAFAAIDEGES